MVILITLNCGVLTQHVLHTDWFCTLIDMSAAELWQSLPLNGVKTLHRGLNMTDLSVPSIANSAGEGTGRAPSRKKLSLLSTLGLSGQAPPWTTLCWAEHLETYVK